jgi:hypothetical protein
MTENASQKSNWKHKYRNLKRRKEREEFKNWSEDDFIDHILELRNELDALEQKHETLKATSVSENKIPAPVEKTIKPETYKQEWSYTSKFVFLLTLENRPLKSIEMHKHLLKLDKSYKFYSDPKTTLSVYLRAAVKLNRIQSLKVPGIKEKFFVLPEWMDTQGKIKEAYAVTFNLFP